ncbi:MAG: hypothetical protein KDB23_22285, partial [Planctomycetales bacterium]|nr:hypothetical protein [Planctomycetales bacterium]
MTAETRIQALERAASLWTGNTEPQNIDSLWLGDECEFLQAFRHTLHADDSELSERADKAVHELASFFRSAAELARTYSAIDAPVVTAEWVEQRHGIVADALQTTTEYDRLKSVLGKLASTSAHVPDSVLASGTMLAAALAWTAEAARRIHRFASENEINEAIENAMHCLQVAWPVATDRIVKDQMNSSNGSPPCRATHVMRKWAAEQPTGQDLRTFSWLSIRHLMEWLLIPTDTSQASSQDATPGQPQSFAIPLYNTSSNQGDFAQLQTQLIPEWQQGIYLDLATSGLLLLDAIFLESLNLAWEVCANAMTDVAPRYGGTIAQRLSLSVQPMCYAADGPSAGGMMALVMYGCAKERLMDPSVSGSFQLKRKDAKHRATLPEHIGVDTVSDVPAKIDALPDRVRTFLYVEPPDESDELRIQRAAQRKSLHLTPIGDFGTAFELFTLGDRLNNTLTPLNSSIDESSRERGGDKLARAAGGFASWLAAPIPYVEPHLGELLPERDARDSSEEHVEQLRTKANLDRASNYRWLTEDESVRDSIIDESQHDVAIAEMSQLIRHPYVCVAEDANSGKTVFSKRLAAFLATKAAADVLTAGRPLLVARWEHGPPDRSEGWPLDVDELRYRLQEIVRPHCDADDGLLSPGRAIDMLLQQGRVVVILDSADQAADRVNVVQSIVRELPNCRLIVTGRTFSFRADAANDPFPRELWKYFTLMPFSRNQQTRYLSTKGPDKSGQEVQGPLLPGQEIEDLFENYSDIQELLGVAGMLAMVRQILLAERKRLQGTGGTLPAVRLTRLRTRCDFYNEFYRRQVLDAGQRFDIERNEPRWQMLLAVTAFRMVLERAANYTVSGESRKRVRQDVTAYCNALAGDSADLRVQSSDWDTLREFSVLSDHSIIEGVDQNVLSFRHKGWLEFFAGIFLAKFAEPRALKTFDFNKLRHRLAP